MSQIFSSPMLSHKTLDHLPARLLEYSWLTAVFLLPLVFWPVVYTSFELPKVVFFRTMTAVMVLLWIWKVLAAGKTSSLRVAQNSSRPHSTVCLVSVLLGLTVLSWFVSTLYSFAPAVSFLGAYPRFQGLFTVVHGVVLAIIVFANLESESQVERIMLAVMGSGLVTSLFALFEKVGVFRLNFWDTDAFLGRAFGTMGHPDFFATFLLLVLVVTVGRILRLQRKDFRIGSEARFEIKKYGAFLANVVLPFSTLCCSFFALLLTSSRSAMLGLMVGLVVLLAVTFWKRKKRWALLATLFVPLFAVLIVVAANVWKPVGSLPFADRLVFQGENLRSIESRMELWPATLKLILERPFFGWGPDSFALTFPRVAPARLNILESLQSYPDRAHNFLLDYAQQFGLVGLVLFIALLVVVFFTAWRLIVRDTTDRWKKILPLFAAEIGLLVALFFGFFVTTLWVFFWLTGAIMLWLIWTPERVPAGHIASDSVSHHLVDLPKLLRSSSIAGSALLAIFFALVGIVLYFFSFETFAADGAFLRSFSGGTAALTASYESVALNPLESVYVLHTVDLLRQKALTESSIDDRNRIFAIANRLADLALRLTNDGGNALIAKAQLLQAQSMDDASLFTGSYRFFEKAVATMPNSPSVHLAYGKALLQGGEKRRALTQFQIYLDLCPRYWEWKDTLSQRDAEERKQYRIFYKLNPNFDEVFGLMERARENPKSEFQMTNQ